MLYFQMRRDSIAAQATAVAACLRFAIATMPATAGRPAEASIQVSSRHQMRTKACLQAAVKCHHARGTSGHGSPLHEGEYHRLSATGTSAAITTGRPRRHRLFDWSRRRCLLIGVCE